MKVKILTILSLFLYVLSYSQSTKTFFISGGVDMGYRSVLGSKAAFFVNMRPEKHIDLFFGTAITKFSGFGYGVGIRIYTLTKTKIIPFVGFAFDNFYYGHHFYINDKETKKHYDPNESSNFYSAPNKFYIPFIGLRKDFSLKADPPDESETINFSILFTFSYRKADVNKEVVFISGVKKETYENRINKDLASGPGGSISFIYYFNLRQKQSENPSQVSTSPVK